MRISYKGDLCTVKFQGHIPVWNEDCLGIEWDDPLRGKHDGTLNGVQYFECRVPGAGSFVKASKPRDMTNTFEEALVEKYTNNESSEVIRVARSKVIETVGAEKFAACHQQIESLETVSLNRMRVSSKGELTFGLWNLKRLDLSYNLLESWLEIWEICADLPSLTSLILNGNRFDSKSLRDSGLIKPLPKVVELSLASTLINSSDLELIGKIFPNVSILNLSNNRLEDLPCFRTVSPIFARLQSFDASNNLLADAPCSVDNLNLANNLITAISTPLLRTQDLNLAYNKISEWSSIDDLAISCPSLSRLRTIGNPLHSVTQDADILTIARLSSVQTLNGVSYSPSERTDAELFFMSKVSTGSIPYDITTNSNTSFRWSALCKIHGEPAKPTMQNTIKSKLLELHIFYDNNLYKIKVLKTMKVQKLKAMAAKKVDVSAFAVALVDQHNDVMDESRNLSFYGLEEGSQIRMVQRK